MQGDNSGSMPSLHAHAFHKRVGSQPGGAHQNQFSQSSTNFGTYRGPNSGQGLEMYTPQQNNFVSSGGQTSNDGNIEVPTGLSQHQPPGSASVKHVRTMVMPQSVKNIHLNPQYQKGMRVMDKNSRLYSAEGTHRYGSTTRRAFQTTMGNFQNRGGPNAAVNLPDIHVGSGVLMPPENLVDLNSPQSNENFQNLFSVNSPSDMSSAVDGMRPQTNAQSRKKHGGGQPSQAQQITIDDISPELAAQIVKNYILPMFESDEKKYLKKKYQDSAVSPRSQKRQPSQSARDSALASQPGGAPKTVYGELKLSEQLSFQLDELKSRFDNLREQLEYTTYQRDTLQRDFAHLQQKHHERGETLKHLKKDMIHMQRTMSVCFQ